MDKPEALTEEFMLNISRGLAASIHLGAAKHLAAHLQTLPDGPMFLQLWAASWREKSDQATVPAAKPEVSMLIADMHREIVETMLKEMGL